MAIGVRGNAENAATNGGDITITLPVGTAQNDYVLLTAGSSLANTGGNLAISTSGYTELLNRDAANNPPATSNAEILIGRKFMTATPDSSVTVTNAAGTSDATSGVCIVYTGVDTTTPEDATTTSNGSASAAAPDGPAITTVTNDARVVSCFSALRTDAAITAPTGYANQVDATADDTRDSIVGMADKTVATGGTNEDPGAWTNIANSIFSAGTVAIRPLASGAKTLVAGAGSYAVTGTAATLKTARKLAAAAGSYAITGTAATLTHGYPIVAGAGSYAITGTAASLLRAAKLAAEAGSYAITGSAAGLVYGHPLAAGAGSYAITGTAVTFIHGTASHTLAADAGSYSITGTAASLERGALVSAGAGSYAITGTDASLLHGGLVPADAGSYAITGSAATLTATGVVVPPETGGGGGGGKRHFQQDYDSWRGRKRKKRFIVGDHVFENEEQARAAIEALIARAAARKAASDNAGPGAIKLPPVKIKTGPKRAVTMFAMAPAFMTEPEREEFRDALVALKARDERVQEIIRQAMELAIEVEDEELLLMTLH